MYYVILAYDSNGFMWESHISGHNAFKILKKDLNRLMNIEFYNQFSIIRAKTTKELTRKLLLCDRTKKRGYFNL